eukprot:Partr_v1_DN28557_c2_g1_i2_m73472 putative DnaJ (Hsp40) homolog, subfamily
MNREEALKCLGISRASHQRGDHEKAQRFAEKSVRLHETEESVAWLAELISMPSPPPASSGNSYSSSTTPPSLEKKQPPPKVTREFTQEQVDAVKAIKKCGEDLYAIIGVSKSATDADLKRAYRKLALQFHPDKNAAPGASEAFKSIGDAYSVLSDPERRRMYDVGGMRRSSTGGSQYQRSSARQGQDLTPEELFNLFFGGGGSMNGASFSFGDDLFQQQHNRQARQFRTPRSRQRPNAQRQSSGGWLPLLVQLLPVLLLAFLSMFNSIFTGGPSYTFNLQGDRTYQLNTHRYQIPYFVNIQDYQQMLSSKNSRSRRGFEDRVEAEYIERLQTQCQRQREEKQSHVRHASWWGSSKDLEIANAMPTTACDELHRLSAMRGAR